MDLAHVGVTTTTETSLVTGLRGVDGACRRVAPVSEGVGEWVYEGVYEAGLEPARPRGHQPLKH